MSRKNLATSLRKRGRGLPMEGFDRLPPELRCWLAGAALPWSARSVARIWRDLHRRGADLAERYRHLDAVERRLLRRDAERIWGRGYPADPAERTEQAGERG